MLDQQRNHTIRSRGKSCRMIILLLPTMFFSYKMGRRAGVGKNNPVAQTSNTSSNNPVSTGYNNCSFDLSQFPLPKAVRPFHRCVYERIPTVLGVLETAGYLLYNSNASFVRFGNGDFDLIRNVSQPYQIASSALSHALFSILTSNVTNLMVGVNDLFGGFPQIKPKTLLWWDDRTYYRTFLLNSLDYSKLYLCSSIADLNFITSGTYCVNKDLVYNTLRKIWNAQNIVYVRGDNDQHYTFDIYDNAKTTVTILAPRYQAWNAYNELKTQLLQEDPSKLFILTCGPVCKVLVYDLALLGRRALDLGHLAKDYDYYKTRKNLSDFFRD